MDSEELEWVMEDYKPISKGVFPRNEQLKRTEMTHATLPIMIQAGKLGMHSRKKIPMNTMTVMDHPQ